MVTFWIMTNSVMYSSSTETHPLIKLGYLQPRSFTGALPRTPFLLTVIHFLKSGNVRQKKLNSKLRQHRSPPQLTTIHMLTHLQKLELAPMSLSNSSNQAVVHLWHCHSHITQQKVLQQNLQWSCLIFTS